MNTITPSPESESKFQNDSKFQDEIKFQNKQLYYELDCFIEQILDPSITYKILGYDEPFSYQDILDLRDYWGPFKKNDHLLQKIGKLKSESYLHDFTSAIMGAIAKQIFQNTSCFVNIDTQAISKAYKNREIQLPRFSLTGRPMVSLHERKMLKFQEKNEGVRIYLPISRYPGVYFDQETKKERNICGTFYFFEPESRLLLDLGKTAIFGSKYHAYISMLLETKDVKQKNDLRKLFQNLDAWKNVPETIVESFYSTIYKNQDQVVKFPVIQTSALYPSDPSSYWRHDEMYPGIHDNFDQPLCKLARKLGFDTIVLQHEIGETRSVTEILDTRDKSENYVFKPEVRPPLLTNFKYSKYATTWFTDYGLLFYDDNQNGKIISSESYIGDRAFHQLDDVSLV